MRLKFLLNFWASHSHLIIIDDRKSLLVAFVHTGNKKTLSFTVKIMNWDFYSAMKSCFTFFNRYSQSAVCNKQDKYSDK